MVRIKRFILDVFGKIFSWLPLRNIILLESYPCYTDNALAVFNEMIRRGWNDTYKIIWFYFRRGETLPDINISNVHFQLLFPESLIGKLWLLFLQSTAKMILSGNNRLPRRRKGQYSMYLGHGGALKDCSAHYQAPPLIDEFLGFSTYLIPYDARNAQYDPERVVVLGYPRLDMLFAPPIDTNQLFDKQSFKKLIYWLPTYRQHRNGELQTSSIPMPILYDENIIRQINDCARKCDVLIVVKPHFVQDISRIVRMNLSNLFFIDEAFLTERGIQNYDLLKSSDALLSDYSSVYYDYLLLDRPIGLCWDDYDEYMAREGIIVDEDEVLSGGEKIYDAEDLCAFIMRIAAGEDLLQERRRAVCDLIHDYQDDQSAKRVVDYLEQKLLNL